MYIATKLERQGKVDGVYKWALYCVFLSKLSLLVSTDRLALFSALLLSSTLAPLFYFLPTSLPPRQALVHSLSLLVALFISRHSLLLPAVETILRHEISETFLFSLLILLWLTASLPLTFKHVSKDVPKRIHLVLLLLSAIYTLLQPETNLFLVKTNFQGSHVVTQLLRAAKQDITTRKFFSIFG